MGSISEINVRLDAIISPMLKNLKTAERNFERTARRLNKIGDDLTTKITVPFAAAGAAAVKFTADVETGFTKIQTLVGISGSALDELKTGVASLSGELGAFQGDLAEGLFVVTSAGIRDTSEALNTLEQANKAAQIGLGETSQIARVAASVVKNYGSDIIDTSVAIDQLTATARAGNFETDQLSNAIGKVLPLANTLGISFAEVGANIAEFTKAGLSAPEAVTGLKSLLSNIIKPGEQASKALAKVGITTEQLRKSVKDQGLAKTLIDLNKVFDGNTEALAKVIPNVEGLVNALATAGSTGDDYVRTLKDIENSTGIVNEGFETVSETANFKFNQALVSLQNVAIKFGAIFLPVVKDAVDIVTQFAKRFDALEPSTKKMIVQVGLVAAAIGPALKLFAGLNTTIATTINFTRLLVSNFAALGAAGPVGLAIVAIGLAAKAMYDFHQATNAAAIANNILTEATSSLQKEVERERQKVGELFEVLKDETAGKQEKREATQALLDQYPNYLKGIDLEKASLSQLALVQQGVNKKILEGVAARKKAEVQAEFLDKIIDKQLRIQEIEENGFKALTFGEQSQGGFFNLLRDDREAVVNKVVNKLKEDVDKLKISADKANESFDNLIRVNKSGSTGRGIGGLLSTSTTTTPSASSTTTSTPLTRGAPIATTSGRTRRPERLDQTLKLDSGFDFLGQSDLDSFLANRKVLIDENVNATETYVESLLNMQTAQTAVAEAGTLLNQIFENNAVLVGGVAEAMAQAAQQGAASFAELANAAVEAAKKIIRVKIQEAVTAVVAKHLTTFGIFGLAAAPAVGAAAAAIFNGLLNKIKLPALAQGALAFGPTVAVVGDNPNAGVNPEVIAPLDKLKNIMGNATGDQMILTTRVSGQDLLIMLDRAEAQRNRTG